MHTLLVILMALAMFGALATLFVGLIGLARGGGNPERSNRLMRYRVLFQGAALLLFALVLSLWR